MKNKQIKEITKEINNITNLLYDLKANYNILNKYDIDSLVMHVRKLGGITDDRGFTISDVTRNSLIKDILTTIARKEEDLKVLVNTLNKIVND